MIVFLFIMSFVVNVVAISVALPTIIHTYRRYSRAKLVVCPEQRREATVAVSPRIAAASAVLIPGEIRVIKACSLWPGLRKCGRACAAQLG